MKPAKSKNISPFGFSRGCRAQKFANFSKQATTPPLATKILPKYWQARPAENHLCQLHASWTGISCLETPPIELQEREPDFKETDGMELWAIKQKSCLKKQERRKASRHMPFTDLGRVGSGLCFYHPLHNKQTHQIHDYASRSSPFLENLPRHGTTTMLPP